MSIKEHTNIHSTDHFYISWIEYCNYCIDILMKLNTISAIFKKGNFQLNSTTFDLVSIIQSSDRTKRTIKWKLWDFFKENMNANQNIYENDLFNNLNGQSVAKKLETKPFGQRMTHSYNATYACNLLLLRCTVFYHLKFHEFSNATKKCFALGKNC